MKARFGINSLPKRERDAVIEAARRVYMDEQEQQVRWMWAVVLWYMHEREGYGEVRLKRMLDGVYDEWQKAEERYELDETMRYGDLCEMRLADMGIDIKAIYRKFEG